MIGPRGTPAGSAFPVGIQRTRYIDLAVLSPRANETALTSIQQPEHQTGVSLTAGLAFGFCGVEQVYHPSLPTGLFHDTFPRLFNSSNDFTASSLKSWVQSAVSIAVNGESDCYPEMSGWLGLLGGFSREGGLVLVGFKSATSKQQRGKWANVTGSIVSVDGHVRNKKRVQLAS
jgi:hypothetical protein